MADPEKTFDEIMDDYEKGTEIINEGYKFWSDDIRRGRLSMWFGIVAQQLAQLFGYEKDN